MTTVPAFFRSTSAKPSFGFAAVVFSALVLLGTWSASLYMLHWQWKETLQGVMRENTNTAVALKEHTLRILDTVDQSIALIQKRVAEGTLTGDALVRIANETGMAPLILTQLSFIDAEGIFQGSNLDPDGSRSKNVNLMEREHVRVHLRPETTAHKPMANGLYISAPLVGKVSNVRTIQLTRKITGNDGRTLGVVVASLNQSYFNSVYQNVEMGNQGGVILMGLDGIIRARVIGNKATEIDKPMPEQALQTIRSHDTGALEDTVSDGTRRIVGFSRVGNYELAVACGTATEEAFVSWNETRNTVLLLMVLLSLAVVAYTAAFIGSLRRLTRSHEALRLSEAEAQRANQAKSEFLAAMSHELRTPLTSIRGFAELMELRSKEQMVREQAHLIRQGAEHLNALLNEILDLAKIEAGAMGVETTSVQPAEVAQEVADLFRVSAQSKGLALITRLAADVPNRITTDRLRLKQILNNLMSNAVKFTRQGSVELAVATSIDGKFLCFHVTDTGPGIDPTMQEKIFEKFRQGNARVSYQHGGTGLGLALARELAHLLGGSIQLQSHLGLGSTFTLELPLAPAIKAAS